MLTKRQTKSRFQTLREQLLGLVLPIECLVCAQEGHWICLACLRELLVTRATTCTICAKAAENGLCRRCAAATQLDGITSLFSYRQTGIQRLVKAVKFAHYTAAVDFFAEEFGRQLLKRLPEEEWSFVPIPLSAARLRQRGFNQSLLFLESLAKHWPIEVWEGLKRNRPTAAQAELTKTQRRANVKNCFTVTTKPVPETVVLFDDVVTTGATLGEAAKVLRRAGAKSVWAATVAHG